MRKALCVSTTPPFLPTGRSSGRAGGTTAAQECGGVDGAQTELAGPLRSYFRTENKYHTATVLPRGILQSGPSAAAAAAAAVLKTVRLLGGPYSRKALKAVTNRKG